MTKEQASEIATRLVAGILASGEMKLYDGDSNAVTDIPVRLYWETYDKLLRIADQRHRED